MYKQVEKGENKKNEEGKKIGRKKSKIGEREKK